MTMHPGRPICSPNYFFSAVGNDSSSVFTLVVMLVAPPAHLADLYLNLKAFSQFQHDRGGLWGINTVICDGPHKGILHALGKQTGLLLCALFPPIIGPTYWSHTLFFTFLCWIQPTMELLFLLSRCRHLVFLFGMCQCMQTSDCST